MLDQDVTDNFPTIKAPLKGWPTMPPLERGKIERPPRKGPPLRAIATIGEFRLRRRWRAVGLARRGRVLAVLRLITRSNRSGRWIGRSLRLAPCRIRPTKWKR
jgi:hypothetical protein